MTLIQLKTLIIFIDDEELMEVSQCTAEPDVDCDWQEWSECSKSCGGGTRTKVRECINQRDPYGNPCNVDLIGEESNASKK